MHSFPCSYKIWVAKACYLARSIHDSILLLPTLDGILFLCTSTRSTENFVRIAWAQRSQQATERSSAIVIVAIFTVSSQISRCAIQDFSIGDEHT